jgi:O-antigen ligase
MTTAAIQVRPNARPPAAAREPAAEANALGFYLFLVVNAALFVRPADVVPALLGVEVYQYLILTCLAVSFPAILDYLQPRNMEGRPIDLCVMLLLPTIMVSHLVGGQPVEMFDNGWAFFKIVVYYLLFVSLVTTPERLRTFCGWLVLFACAVTVLAAMDFHKVIHLPRTLSRLGTFAAEDETRMYGPGIFQDPNDICVLIVAAGLLLLGRLADTKTGSLRWAWLVPLAILAYGFYLTRSRGGMVALLAGLLVVGVLRWGWQRALMLGLLLGPFLVAGVLAMRGVDIDSHEDTGQARIQLWNDGMVMFRSNPVFGVGLNQYSRYAGQVAHNSYMQAFAELGAVGGTLFFGAALLAITRTLGLLAPARLQDGTMVPRQFIDPCLEQQFPFVAGCVTAYMCGMLTLSLNELVVTYTFFGMASMLQATAKTTPAQERKPAGVELYAQLFCLGLVFLGVMFLVIRVAFRA